MAIPPDPLAALVGYLLADADVAGLAGTRIYGGELPDESSQPTLPPTVVLQDAGGRYPRSNSQQYTALVDVRSYAPTPIETKQLDLACTTALNRLARTIVNGTVLFSAIKEDGPRPGRSQTSLWPFSLSVWSIETSFQEVN